MCRLQFDPAQQQLWRRSRRTPGASAPVALNREQAPHWLVDAHSQPKAARQHRSGARPAITRSFDYAWPFDLLHAGSVGTHVAGQFTAALRPFSQVRTIPATAKSLNQEHGTCEASAQNVNGSHLISQGCALGGGHLKVAGDTAFVPNPA